MNQKYTFYIQQYNSLFGGPVLSICYKASKDEVERFGLTGENVLIILKSEKLEEKTSHESMDFLI